jgi:hypothetical protein
MGLGFYTRGAVDGSGLCAADEKMRITYSGAIKNQVDNAGFYTGDSDDLRMFATGGYNYIDSNNGCFYILNDCPFVVADSGGSVMLRVSPNSSVDLYFCQGNRLSTTSTGVNINGYLEAVVQWTVIHHAAGYGHGIKFQNSAPDNNSTYYFTGCDCTTARVLIYSDGDLANHDGVYGTISDIKYKQDISDARSYWDDFADLRYRKWKDKTDVETYGDDAQYRLGLVAQEVEPIFPALAPESPDDGPDPDNNETHKWVKSSIIEGPILGKVLQEAQARIETLEAQVAALQN